MSTENFKEPVCSLLADVQSQKPALPIRINRVGIRDLSMPVIVRQRDSSEGQRTIAKLSLSVDLPAEENGTHMSRFVNKLQSLACESQGIDYSVLLNLLQETSRSLNAQKAQFSMAFPFFLSRKAPVSEIAATVAYQCRLEGEIDIRSSRKDAFSPFSLSVTVPVMTVCPCSKAISAEGAHSQRANVNILARIKGYVWLEEMIELAEKSGSSPVYSLLKRPDEKFVTEQAFANPCFVEDVARNVANALSAHPKVEAFSVEVESFESIHAHNAFAYIEG